jgi:hypothetical protein
MEKKTKAIGGAGLAIVLALAGGASLTAAAQVPALTNQVQQADTGIEDGTNDGETADDTDAVEVEDTSDDVNGVEVEEGHTDGGGGQNEDTSDDVNGVEVEDGTAD